MIFTWPQVNANWPLLRLQLVDKGSEREPFWSMKKNEAKENEICVSKVEFRKTRKITREQQQQQHYHRHHHHHHHYHQQQELKLIMEQNNRTTTASGASKRSLLPEKCRRDKIEDSTKLSNDERYENVEEYNWKDVCCFATTVAIEKQQQQQRQHLLCKSKRLRFEDKVEVGSSKVEDKRGSLCFPLFARPINKNNNLSTTHLSLSILIFILHLSISSCLQPVLSEHKVPLLHQQDLIQQHGEVNGNNNNNNNNNHNMILSKCK